jgi:uncharacterized protein
MIAATPDHDRGDPMPPEDENAPAVTIHVDADACPVRDVILKVARPRGVPVVFYASRDHRIPEEPGARVVVVDPGPDMVDLRIANATRSGDVVVTGDFGLATLCLSRGAMPVSFRGEPLDESRIDGLMEARHLGRRVRRGGGRTPGPKALTQADRERFRRALEEALDAREGQA